MSNNDTYEYSIAKTEEDLIKYKECFDNNDSPKSLDRLKWMHFQNPPQKTLINFAVEKNSQSVGGIYTTFPVYFMVKEEKVVACQSIDTLVDKNHRKKGLFKKLAAENYTQCEKENIDFVYGFPNANSAFAFFNRLGWSSISEIPFRVKILHSRFIKNKLKEKNSFLGKLFPAFALSRRKKISLPNGYRIVQTREFGDEHETLWRLFSKNIDVSIDRSKVYLNWRIFQKPNFKYQVESLYHGEKLIAYIIHYSIEKHGGQVGYILDFIFDKKYDNESSVLLKNCHNSMIDKNTEIILIWNFKHSPNHKVFKVFKYRVLPKVLQSIKLFFGFKSFSNKNVDLISKKENWYLSYLDSDTV